MSQIMKTKECYYMVLAVYISLWTCQLIVCHLTHSLIVLADSYINLYKILDISLGILHLSLQTQLKKRNDSPSPTTATGAADKFVAKLFGRQCTYDFRRLPVLGAFVNGLFLAALLMSAAIEGVQTCFHVGHVSAEGETSILMEHPVTYPGILAGFALVGVMMQWCSNKVHEMREEELQSESLLDLRSRCGDANSVPMRELDVGHLRRFLTLPADSQQPGKMTQARKSFNDDGADTKRNTICLDTGRLRLQKSAEFKRLDDATQVADSFETVPLDDDQPTTGDHHDKRGAQMPLKPLGDGSSGAGNKQLDANNKISSISKDLEAPTNNRAKSSSRSDKWWLAVRYCASPLALIICALTFYFINNELITEIADATLAILVVILLFTSSYPPMKKASKVLLQSAPEPVDVDALRSSLMSVSPSITGIADLHVWSLTARSNRVATCKILISADKVKSEKQVSVLLREVKFKLLEQNIKCTAIQPTFVEPAA